MTLDEKIGQLIIPATIGMFLSQDSEVFQQARRDITKFHVGGYHMLGEVNILHEPAGVALFINHLQELAKVPLWITADFEGGVGLRYIGATRLPRAMAMGATANPDFAYQAGRITAEEARALGIQVNFYPVVDVNNNARNPIINIRSFGGDPRTRVPHGSRIHSRLAGTRRDGHGQALSRSRRYIDRFAPRVAVDRCRPRAFECDRAAAVSRRGGRRTSAA